MKKNSFSEWEIMGNRNIEPLNKVMNNIFILKQLFLTYFYIFKNDLKEISEKTSIPLNAVKKCYKEFEEIVYMDETNSISKSAFDFNFFFDKRYQVKSKNIDLFLNQLFSAFDEDNSGALSFQEFLIGKMLFESNSQRDNLKIFFRLFDISKDKRIEKCEIEQILTILGREDTIGADKSYADFANFSNSSINILHNKLSSSSRLD